jgi:hypothetical protein
MTLILSGTNGLSDVDGDASTPAVRGTDANTGIFFPAADTIAFAEGGAEAMRINASGNVGIGTTNPTVKFQVEGTIPEVNFVSYSGANNYGVTHRFQTAKGSLASPTVVVSGGEILTLIGQGYNGSAFSTAASIRMNVDGAPGVGDMPGRIGFFTTPDGSAVDTERARITSGGFFKASVDGTYNNAAGYHELKSNAGAITVTVSNTNASTPNGIFIYWSGATPNNTSQYFLYCQDATNEKAIIWANGNFESRTNSYGGISDVKLKQDIVDANSQWDDIKGLRVVKYRFKDEVAADPNYPSHLGVIAQEVELVSPGLIDEHPDYEEIEVPVLDDEGNPVLNEDGTPQVTKERNALGTTTKSVKYSILYMKAVKALQEAIDRIETLEASNTALEARIAALETGV